MYEFYGNITLVKKFLFLLFAGAVFVLTITNALAADKTPGLSCVQGIDKCLDGPGGSAYDCQPSGVKDRNTGMEIFQCLPVSPIGKIFGKINVPGTLGGLIKNNLTGAGAISQFLTNFITLLYSIAGIILVFMLVWAAFEWLTSGGEKEKVAAAQKRILHAIIGIILLAVAFAVIKIFGVFTGFTFFAGQNTATPSSVSACTNLECGPTRQNCYLLPANLRCVKNSTIPGDCSCVPGVP